MDSGDGIEAIEAASGKPLWHCEIGALTAPPETFLVDGKQCVLASAASGLLMFVAN